MSDGKDELDDDLLIDHEKYAGAVMKDPWDDDEQEDWPNNRGEDSDGLGENQEPG